ncbi:uncharacterized protein A1O9_02968 [Exophiala aquamarina CBS 119918]|uniref:Integral membrane protein n=1 Tax=Exophiala aquamarina CBS 119918 TaxID=1182545 RepID=A0A072PNT9_9EURO|nr:uncharacterized protein A1O9_02968 [Exophiala aquamarina CBS 119918]KEF61402.1 hypothetical protein A1O9_02968 [Exophiala aquamarina CBS 119918]
MPRRNQHFLASLEPFRNHESLSLQRAEGPFAFLNPTRAHYQYPVTRNGDLEAKQHHSPRQHPESHVSHADHGCSTSTYPASFIQFLWRSRDNRKGRHTLLVRRPSPDSDSDRSRFLTPRRTSHPREVLRNIGRTFTCFPIWDISWLVAFVFTLGSAVWVINSFFVWLPVVAPSTEFPNEIFYGGGITAFIGAIIFFEFGSVLLIFEAVNVDNSGCFGWAVEQLLDEHEHEHDLGDGQGQGQGQERGQGGPRLRVTPNKHHCRHHHQNKHNFVGNPSQNTISDNKPPPPPANGDPSSSSNQSPKSWQWFPSAHALRTHYLHELGFLAGAAQLFGATIFGISGITALPGIYNHLEPQYVLNAAYWIPQVIGGSGFIVSSTLYMLETQTKWYIPAPKILGWHVAFWNLIGAFGFTLCGALGMAYGNSGAQFQAGLATFWGSWAFLIGSYLQLYEALDKHPVEEGGLFEDEVRRRC